MKYLIALYLVYFSLIAFSQTLPIKNLVFEGAGIRGIAYAGVVEELEKHDLLADIEKVGGTSAGAITALMVSIGYSSAEISTIISSTEFNKFNDGRFIFFGGFHRMKKRFGWYRGERFLKWIAKIIADKTQNENCTFSELAAMGYKNLSVTATCINRQGIIVFSKDNYPDMKVKDAVRISMSIPLYFQAVFIDQQGKVYKNSDDIPNLDIVIDGGTTSNFPIFIFDSIAVIDDQEIRIHNPSTLGFRIDSDAQIKNDQLSKDLIPLEINSFNDYITSFYIYIIENLNRNMLTQADWERTVSVSSKGIGPKIKKLSEAQKELLIESGRKAVIDYLANINNN